MSWSHINGTITIMPFGRSQAEKRYVLDTVLAHLPKIKSEEGEMNIYTIQKNGFDSYTSTDEFGQFTNLGNSAQGFGSCYGYETQNYYIIVVDGYLRYKEYGDTLREFTKWLCRLSKRIIVTDIFVKVSADEKRYVFDNYEPFEDMFENFSWTNEKTSDTPNWCEFMLWDNAKGTDFPALLAYKYFSDEDNDAEVERRLRYHQKSRLK